MPLYQNAKWGFSITLPDSWKTPGFLRRLIGDNSANPEFYDAVSGDEIKFAIGPIIPLSTVPMQQRELVKAAEGYGHRALETGAMRVCGKEHATMVCEIPYVGIVKNYSLVFGEIEYLISARGDFGLIDRIVMSFEPKQHREGDSREEARNRFTTALQYEVAANYEGALAEFEAVITMCRKLGAYGMASLPITMKARVFRNQGKIDQALKCIEESMVLCEREENSLARNYALAQAMLLKGNILLRLRPKDRREAEGVLEEAIGILEEECKIDSGSVPDHDKCFLLPPDSEKIGRMVNHDKCVNKINLADILIVQHENKENNTERQNEDGIEKAAEYADSVMESARKFGDVKLKGAAYRIKGMVSETREDWEEAKEFYEKSLAAYEEFGHENPAVKSFVEGRLLDIQIIRSRGRETEESERYRDYDKVPEEIVYKDKPFLRHIDNHASAMPPDQAWKFYQQAAYFWDDAGWRDRCHGYLVKACDCIDGIRKNLPLRGQFPADVRAEFFAPIVKELFPYLISLLSSETEGGKTGVSDPIAEAFYYREQLGAVGFLDELQASDIEDIRISEIDGKHVGDDGDDAEVRDLELNALVTGEVSRIEAVQQGLSDGTVLIEYLLSDKLFVIFVITKDTKGIEVLWRDALRSRVKEVNPKELEEKVCEFTLELSRKESDLNELKKKGQWLYDRLLLPTEWAWFEAGKIVAERLIIVPHGILHDIPFSTLFDGNVFLAEKIPSTQSPSASVLRYCHRRRPKEPVTASYFGFANPMCGKEGIPGCDTSVEVAAGKFGCKGGWIRQYDKIIKKETIRNFQLTNDGRTAFCYRGKLATSEAFFENAPNFSVVDIETHGEMPEESPMEHCFLVTDEKGNNKVMARDIFKHVRMRPEILIAAFCESGKTKPYERDEQVGLIRAFMFAGCRSILTYPWLLSDTAAEIFMNTFYDHLLETDGENGATISGKKDVAMQKAQIALIREGRKDEGPNPIENPELTWEHPYFWAWKLIGDYS
uniref:CHAT domain-containing protein n=1 Tax=Candidatus Kentrum sp. MB TaxID=2138164 RepID=A0A450Y1D7_9GAMM|nr:MAG: CHAT domain-containing protein [Candidatus Kentron sp. MB]VFK35357.1 MAG: CHAT domain-containing protein [Candidatus Kentron sp. MB]VFK77243.1 MAG: CHAT domain-containing protein [Candidatus Kentron sp. MB]